MLQINEELKRLIPPLQPEEYSQLEKSIISDGCRDAIITWQGVIVDGHNRYEICQKNGIEYQTTEKEFAHIDEVKIWMIDNQKGRRNLSDGWMWELAQTKKELLTIKGRENLKIPTGGKSSLTLSTIDKVVEPINTQKEVAKELGWSTGKVAMADKVWKEAKPEVKEAIKNNEVSINQAYSEIQKQQKVEKRKKEIERQKAEIENGTHQLPDGVFEVVVIDPPWSYGREYDPESSRVANPYPEMDQSELLKLSPPFADDCVLFLWTTHKFLFDAKELMDKWGFDYKANLVWNKEKIGMGAWLRMQCEFCLVGIKGKPAWNNTTHRDIISESRREHSRKPESFYTFVEQVTTGRRLDYFSRAQRDGWEVFGNDTEKFPNCP